MRSYEFFSFMSCFHHKVTVVWRYAITINRWIIAGLIFSAVFFCSVPFLLSQYLTIIWLAVPIVWTCFFSYRHRQRLNSWRSFMLLLIIQFLSLYALRQETLKVEATMAGVATTTTFSFMFATLYLILNICLFFPIMLNIYFLLKKSDASLFLTLLTWFIYPSLLLPIVELSGIDQYFANPVTSVELPVSFIFTFGMPFSWIIPAMCLAPWVFIYHLIQLVQKRLLVVVRK